MGARRGDRGLHAEGRAVAIGAVVGDVYGRLGLDSSGFTSGVAAAQQGAARIQKTFDGIAGGAGTATDALDRHGKGLELGARTMDRFAAIGIEKLIPSLEGSRVGIEGVLNGVYKLAGGYATLILAGVGVAGFMASYLTPALFGNNAAIIASGKGVEGFEEDLKKLETRVSSTSGFLRQMQRDVEALDASGASKTPSGARLLANLAREGATGEDALDWKTRAGLVGMRAQKALGPDFSEAMGLSVGASNKLAGDLSRVFTTLDKEIATFRATSNEVLVDDPLGRVLISDYAKTQRLIDKLIEAREQGVYTQDEFDKRAGTLAAEAGGRQIKLRDQAALGGSSDLASRLGLGDSGIAKGFGDVKQLTKDADDFKAAMIALVREGGIPARDIFPQIAEGQAKFNERIAALKEKYADTPAIFNKLVEAERSIGNSEIIRGLNDTVNALGDIKKGTVSIADAADGLDTKYTPALLNTGTAANYLSGVLYDDMPKAALAADKSMVTLTGNANLLADALARAYWNALALSQVSVANAGVATAPGNF